MKELRKEFAGYSIVYKTIEKKENKKSYKGLTIEEMIRFVSGMSVEEQEVFNKVIEVASNRQGKYAIVKKWFMNHYKEAYAKEIEAQEIDKELQDIEAELAEMDDEMLEDIA